MRWFGLVTSTIHGFHFKTFIFCHVYIERRHGSEVSENRKPLERLESPAVFLQCGRTELTQSSSAISPAKRASEVAVCGFTEGIPFLIDAYLVLHKYSEVHKETDKQKHKCSFVRKGPSATRQSYECETGDKETEGGTSEEQVLTQFIEP